MVVALGLGLAVGLPLATPGLGIAVGLGFVTPGLGLAVGLGFAAAPGLGLAVGLGFATPGFAAGLGFAAPGLTVGLGFATPGPAVGLGFAGQGLGLAPGLAFAAPDLVSGLRLAAPAFGFGAPALGFAVLRLIITSSMGDVLDRRLEHCTDLSCTLKCGGPVLYATSGAYELMKNISRTPRLITSVTWNSRVPGPVLYVDMVACSCQTSSTMTITKSGGRKVKEY